MGRRVINLVLLVLVLLEYQAWGQKSRFGDCGQFEMGLREEFIEGKNADSLVLARNNNEKFREFYQGADEETRLMFQFINLLEADSNKVAYSKFLSHHYLGAVFPQAKAETLEGKTIRLPESGTITVVNTWFTRCKPCLEEMPALNGLRESFGKDQRVQFVALAKDRKEDLEAFLATHEFKYEIVADEEASIIGSLCLSQYPTHMVIDAEGLIRYFCLGIADAGEMKAVIDELLKNMP